MLTRARAERVRKLRLALGGKPEQIRDQFLIEASILCLIGGVLGLAIAGLTSVVLATPLDSDVPILDRHILLALATSIVIGLLAGILPATRAAALSPIEARR